LKRFSGVLEPRERQVLEQYCDALTGPLCFPFVRPADQWGYPLYATMTGGMYVIDIAGGGAVAGVASNLLLLTPAFLDAHELGYLCDGTTITLSRKGQTHAGKNYLIHGAYTAIKPGAPTVNAEWAWRWAPSDGIMFVQRFVAEERQATDSMRWDLTLDRVTFTNHAGGADAHSGSSATTAAVPESPAPAHPSADTVPRSATAAPVMTKQVSERASFVTYAPEGWQVCETDELYYRSVVASDPSGALQVGLLHGQSPDSRDPCTAICLLVRRLQRAGADVTLSQAWREGSRVVCDGTGRDAGGARTTFRCWAACDGARTTLTWIAAPASAFDAQRRQLLTIMANMQVTKGSFEYRTTAPAPLSMTPYRLPDASAAVLLPQGWNVQYLGPCAFIASDESIPANFIVASVEVLSPSLGVSVPGAFVAEYLQPHEAFVFLANQQQLASHIRMHDVTPRADLNQMISRVYTGPVSAEEFQYTFRSHGRTCKGFTFGISFGTRLRTNWRFWHMTATADGSQFDSLTPTFVKMFESYRIDDQYAQQYIARGMARLREMQRQTSALVARNAAEIHAMMQAAFEERMRSWDYIDYQRTRYIRGEQDGISTMEGGTIYRSDQWGTRNTATGDYIEGQPFNYVNFVGDHPRYNERMTPIDTRELWERYIAR
jgi:hypothetical protein